MAGYNLHSYLSEYVAQRRGAPMVGGSAVEISDANVFARINNAILEIQRFYKVDLIRDNSVSVSNGVSSYAIPRDRLGSLIRSVRIRDSDNLTIAKLQFLPYDDFCQMYDLDLLTEDSGDPSHWTFDKTNRGKILIRPTPDYTRSAGVVFDYAPTPVAMSRIWNQSTVTATFTNGSTTVTLSAGSSTVSDMAVRVQALDEIGYVPTANSDGVTLQTQSSDVPRTWARIASGGVTVASGSATITLEEAWTDLTASSARFIVAQVSELELANPGSMLLAPVYWGLSQEFASKDSKSAAAWRAQADDILSRLFIEEYDAPEIPRPTLATMPWMFT